MNYKIYLLKMYLEARGISYLIKRIVFYLLRPITSLIKRNKFLVNLQYGILPQIKRNLFSSFHNSEIIQLPQTELVQQVRKFWYSNVPGYFNLDGEKISRRDIFCYGGPNPKFTCLLCQKSEWLSRIRQRNLFQPHRCSQTRECEELCKKQGNELWTHFHQNFDFSIGCNLKLPAPRILYIYSGPKEEYREFLTPRCDQATLVFRRQLAIASQIEIVRNPVNIDWSRYDLMLVGNSGFVQRFSRPNIPIILTGGDFDTKNKYFQWMIDWINPDVFLTPYPTQWLENFKFSSKTKIVFYPRFPSLFFTRPNLENKKFDLLVIGTIATPVYSPRRQLDKQLSQLIGSYKIEFSHSVGHLQTKWTKENSFAKENGKIIRYLNKWSEYLSLAKYVIFGKIADPKRQFLLGKYYETLGSGAVPIFPEVPDLKLLKVKPFEHYIPLSAVEGNNEKLKYYLDNYRKYKYIAENAVNWYRKYSDKMLFEDFENLIREITDYKYPKRLIQ